LQISNAKTSGWYEMDYDDADGVSTLNSPIWIEACSMRVVITGADPPTTDLDVAVQRV
jgi:hypothetical protein